MSVLLDIAYASGLVLSSPVWLYRMIRHGRYRHDIGQKFGAAPIRYGLQPVIWIHGVSLGEVNAARTLVNQLHSQLPDYQVMITSTTETGMAAAKRLFGTDHVVFRWPFDFTMSVASALDRVRPSLVVLMEGEVWPNFLAACNRRNIPAVVVNARLSADKGYPRYRRLGSLATRLFNRLTAIGAQDEDYARRYVSLGVNPDKVRVTGMIKYDTAEVADSLPGQDALAAAVGLQSGQTLIVGGGTGDGEEEILLDAFVRLKARHAACRLAIVPRKPERFNEVAGMIAAKNLPVVRRSQNPDGTANAHPDEAVILGDTMGELRKFYSLATCVFVGRSLVPMGGSDMIESAALAKATCFGPHTFNFPQADTLAQHGCARLADAQALYQQLDQWLADPAAAAKAGQSAQQFVKSQMGATRRNVEMICEILNRRPALSEGGISTDKIFVQS